MATMKTAILVGSIVANVALTTYLVASRDAQPDPDANEARPSADTAVALASNGDIDALALGRLLAQQGFDDHETKLVVLAFLNAAALDGEPSAPYEYWRPDDPRSAAS